MHNCVLQYELHSVRNYVPCLRCGQENDSDYEGQSQEEEDENYICALNEPETDEQQEGEETDEEESELLVVTPSLAQKLEAEGNY